MKKIWIYAECYNGQVANVTLELLTKALEMATTLTEKAEISAVMLGDNLVSMKQQRDILEGYGADKIYVICKQDLKHYNPTVHGGFIEALVKMGNPDIFMFGATAIGSDLAPYVAALSRTGIAAHCVDLRLNADGMLVANVPAFGGKIIGEILIPNTLPQMASVKPGIFIKKETDKKKKSEIIIVEFKNLVKESKLNVIRETIIENASMPLEEADVVIAGGYGLGNCKNWDQLEEMACIIGGAAGATRPCIDEGWAPGEHIMIGTSGKSIRPRAYIGFGVSGSTHHICGMKDSGLVISINNDENAPIFQVSDYYVVDDLNEFIPKFLEAVKASSQQ